MGMEFLRPDEAQWLVEYQAIKKFHWSHEQYINTPGYAVQWLMGIAALEAAIQQERQDRAVREAKAGRG